MHAADESTVGSSSPAKALVVCIGNDLVWDDAAGCEVYNALSREALHPHISLLRLGVGGVEILEYLKGMYRTLVVVDAVRFGSEPGTLHRSSLNSMPPTHHGAVSVHGLGIRELIEAGTILHPESMPENIVCIGIEGENFDECGVPLSARVRTAVDDAVILIRDTLSI